MDLLKFSVRNALLNQKVATVYKQLQIHCQCLSDMLQVHFKTTVRLEAKTILKILEFEASFVLTP